jgi:hypothetical protein
MEKKMIDLKVLTAALDELRPVCKQIFALYTWEQMIPMQIVDCLAQEGVALTAEQVWNHIRTATRHCERRLNESEVGARLNTGSTMCDPNTHHPRFIPVSEHIWIENAAPTYVFVH